MTVQNGIGADEIVARHGDWRILSAVTFMSGTRHVDTHVAVRPRHGDVDRAGARHDAGRRTRGRRR